MTLPTRGRARWAALAAIVVGLAAGGVAYASIPDADGTIHACYMKSGGSLRVIDASVTNCKSGETSLTWNQSGSAGATGPTGPTGAAGPTEGVAAAPSFSPPTTPTNQLPSDAAMTSTFTTTISGKLHLAKPVHAGVFCQTPRPVWWWIILDGVAVPSSFTRTDSDVSATQTLVGVTDNEIAAGTHTMDVGAMCDTGQTSGSSVDTFSGGTVIVLG